MQLLRLLWGFQSDWISTAHNIKIQFTFINTFERKTAAILFCFFFSLYFTVPEKINSMLSPMFISNWRLDMTLYIHIEKYFYCTNIQTLKPRVFIIFQFMLYVFLCTHSYTRTDAEQQFTHTIPKSDKNFIQTTVEK